jgi:DNA recombination protein RmuC
MEIDIVSTLIGLAAGVAAGGMLAWWIARTRGNTQLLVLEERAMTRESRLRELADELLAANDKHQLQMAARDKEAGMTQLQLRDLDARLATSETQLREERKQWESKVELLNQAEAKLGDAFRSLSADVLKNSNASFLEMAQQTLSTFHARAQGDLAQREQAVQAMVDPIHKSLAKVEQQIQQVEKERAQAFGSLTEHLGQVAQGQDRLRTETGNLVKALRAPQARGRWGEIQLKRVVEMAGMLEHCDFEQQASAATADGKLRPDLIVRLPGGKNIVVDAKTPLAAYLEALEAGDENSRVARLDEHARQVRTHMTKLSSKQYWMQFQPTPEFVVLFLPGESFFSAALQQDPGLIEEGVAQNVIVATPTTLIALLRAVHFGWRQEKVREESQKVAALGNELYERVRTFASHLTKVGSGLNSAVDSYNRAVGSLETRVMVSTRKFRDYGAATGDELPELEHVQAVARAVETTEFVPQRILPLQEPEMPSPPAAVSVEVVAVIPAEPPPAPAEVRVEISAARIEALQPKSRTRVRNPMDRLLAAMGRAPPPAGGAGDEFPDLEDVLAAPLPEKEVSMEEIMAIVGDDPAEPMRPA